MKVARRLTFAIAACMCLVVGANGLLRFRHDREVFEADMRRDHAAIGDFAAGAVAQALASRGWQQALLRIERMNQREGRRLHIRWLDGAVPGPPGPRGGRFFSYVPLPAESPQPGWIEISESLEEERAYLDAGLKRTVLVTGVMIAAAALLSALLGYRMIGAPLERLAAKARRVGLGDLSAPLPPGQEDELGELAREMNVMCERLREANARVSAAAASRADALEALRQSDRLATVGKLASGVAHELGTPLNVIAARAGMIAAGEGTLDDLAGYGRIITAQTERITRIVRQLMIFARGRDQADLRRAPIAREAVDLRDVAVASSQLLKPLASQRLVGLDVEKGGTAIAMIEPGLVEQAMANLTLNAIQASPSGATVTLAADTARCVPPTEIGGGEGTFARLIVSDEGPGISPETLPRIFEPFFTTKDVGEGSGLGLSVAYGIVRDHGGWIAVESRPGTGSRFTMFLPAASD